MRKTLAERFEEKTCPEPNTGCLLWTAGCVTKDERYGVMWVGVEGRKREIPTRVAFRLHYGRWPKRRVLSLCQTPLCVEWSHLEEAGVERVKPCRRCGSTLRYAPRPPSDSTKGSPLGDCVQCARARPVALYRADPVLARAVRRAQSYGISVEVQWELFNSQGGKCAVEHCRAKLTFRRAHIDHNHACCPKLPTCGQCVRGFLCNRCNTALGGGRDNPLILRSLAKYLDDHPLAVTESSRIRKPSRVARGPRRPYSAFGRDS